VRRRNIFCLIACLLVALALAGCDIVPAPGSLPAIPTPAQAVEARVAYVVDGDSIAVDIDGQRYAVRYIGVDTPELRDPENGRPQPFAQEAKAINERLVEGRVVRLERDVSERDRYGRLLRYVWVDGRMINAELVRLGYAQVSSFPPDVRHIPLFLQLQIEAQDAQRGLWGLAR
jgi:micrococcal nuclease